MSFRADIFLLVFCLDDLSIAANRVFRIKKDPFNKLQGEEIIEERADMLDYMNNFKKFVSDIIVL